jgi:ankyrin repeat protein
VARRIHAKNSDKTEPPDGYAPLHQAVLNNNVEIAKGLLEHGADVDAKTLLGFTSLHYAARNDNPSIVHLLLQHHANPNIGPDYCDFTPIMYTTLANKRPNYMEIAEALLKHGADMNACDGSHETAWQRVLSTNKYRLVRLANKCGANACGSSVTIAHTAIQRGNMRLLKELVEYQKELLNDKHCLIKEAASNGRMEMVKELLKMGTSVKGAMFSALQKQHFNIATFLVRHGISVNDRGDDRTSPLYNAASRGDLKGVVFCVENGGAVNVKGANTPLHAAILLGGGHVEMLAYLLMNGADVDMENNEGHTPLLTAVHGGHVWAVECLLKYGTDVNVNGGLILRAAVAESNNAQMMEILLAHGASVKVAEQGHQSLIHVAVGTRKGAFEKVTVLLKYGAQVPTDAPVALIRRVVWCTPLLKLLLEHGASTTVEEGEISPLICVYGDVEQIKMLLEHGAGVNYQHNGCTPLSAAVQLRHWDAVRVLLDAGANVNDGCTSLYPACDMEQWDIVKLLLEVIKLTH